MHKGSVILRTEAQKRADKKYRHKKLNDGTKKQLNITLDTDNYSFKQQIENLRQQLKSQPEEIVEKIRRELGLKLKYKLNDEVYVLKICNQINEVLDNILKEYQK